MNMKVENEMALPITKSVTVMLLEPYAGKLARTVLRGESSRKGADLLDFLKRKTKRRLQQPVFHQKNRSEEMPMKHNEERTIPCFPEYYCYLRGK